MSGWGNAPKVERRDRRAHENKHLCSLSWGQPWAALPWGAAGLDPLCSSSSPQWEAGLGGSLGWAAPLRGIYQKKGKIQVVIAGIKEVSWALSESENLSSFGYFLLSWNLSGDILVLIGFCAANPSLSFHSPVLSSLLPGAVWRGCSRLCRGI